MHHLAVPGGESSESRVVVGLGLDLILRELSARGMCRGSCESKTYCSIFCYVPHEQSRELEEWKGNHSGQAWCLGYLLGCTSSCRLVVLVFGAWGAEVSRWIQQSIEGAENIAWK